MDKLNFDTYQEKARRTAGDKDIMLNAAMGLVGESGEVMDLLKKALFQGHAASSAAYANELGDIMWYISLMCDAIGYSMEEVAQMNIEKLKKRYPDGFSVEKSVNREVD